MKTIEELEAAAAAMREALEECQADAIQAKVKSARATNAGAEMRAENQKLEAQAAVMREALVKTRKALVGSFPPGDDSVGAIYVEGAAALVTSAGGEMLAELERLREFEQAWVESLRAGYVKEEGGKVKLQAERDAAEKERDHWHTQCQKVTLSRTSALEKADADLETAKGLLADWVKWYQIKPEDGGAHQRIGIDSETRAFLKPQAQVQPLNHHPACGAHDGLPCCCARGNEWDVPKPPCPSCNDTKEWGYLGANGPMVKPCPECTKPPCPTCDDKGWVYETVATVATTVAECHHCPDCTPGGGK